MFQYAIYGDMKYKWVGSRCSDRSGLQLKCLRSNAKISISEGLLDLSNSVTQTLCTRQEPGQVFREPEHPQGS